MRTIPVLLFAFGILCLSSCKIPTILSKQENRLTPDRFGSFSDTSNIASIKWATYFNDPYLISLIDTALKSNQELNILAREVSMDKNEIQARKGEYLPFVSVQGASGIEKAGKYTWDGLAEEDLKANPDKGPKYIGNQMVGLVSSWELDFWKKLHNAEKAAALRYLASNEGRNFAKTTIVAEIARSYYELLGLDNMLRVINQNIEIQKNALEFIRYEIIAAKVTQLAVNRFEAQLLNTENLQFEIKQQIIETENRINFLLGRFPQQVPRSQIDINNLTIGIPSTGIPSQLLINRPDIRQAEYILSASKLDIEIARANFFPSVRLMAGVGLNAFNPTYLIKPASILYNISGELIAPLINKNAIQATYSNAGLKQITAAYQYERTILNAYIEVVNELAKIDNYQRSFAVKAKEVDILNQSVSISKNLFTSARADYIEVLLTQREALNSTIELIELRQKQLQAKVEIYRSLGGGWND